ncbi:MAG: alginate export family protein [Verrucomicrobia bacterium]|nr:alginate export family protein [Verrucomicrobiota bacterium]
MRNGWFISLLLALPQRDWADDMTTPEKKAPAPPTYQLLRFDESYSYLADPANRSDWFDPIKYIPLRAGEPGWYLTLGGEARERFEGVHDPNFGIGGAGADSRWVQRLTFLGDLHLGDRVRVFAEGISGLIEGESQPAPPVQNDPIDLAYAFLDVVPYNGDERLTLRGGRFGMSLGSGRLVATRAAPSAPNIPFRFDGFEMLYAAPSWEATAFLTRPAKDSGYIDGSNPNTTFWRLYVTHWFDTPRQIGLDLYYIGIVNNPATYAPGTADEDRHSFGLRFFGKRNRWEWNLEDVVQVFWPGPQALRFVIPLTQSGSPSCRDLLGGDF